MSAAKQSAASVAARPLVKWAGERWKSIRGFLGYEVSDLGRVRSWRTPGRARGTAKSPRILTLNPDRDGYVQVQISRAPGQPFVVRKIHHLVLEAFVGARPKGTETRHLDSNPRNNRLGNLQWAPHRRNVRDQIERGTDTRGERNGWAKLTYATAQIIRRRRLSGELGSHLAREFNISQATVCRIAKGLRYAHA